MSKNTNRGLWNYQQNMTTIPMAKLKTLTIKTVKKNVEHQKS